MIIMKKQIKESNLNRILSHMEDKDIATITAFRTDPELGISNKENRKRNKKLESELNKLGYRGFTKIVGYWDERPDDKDSAPIAEESYVVLNTGNKSYEEFVVDMIYLCYDLDGKEKLDQQSVMIWNHEDKKAHLYDKNGNIVGTFNSFNIDTIAQGWSQVKGHTIAFVEESTDIRFGFTDKHNKDGNWMTAMFYDSARRKIRENRSK